MKQLDTIAEMNAAMAELTGKSIGFVPTMGYFHQGHLSLMEQSIKENDVTVVSIYVNPSQFGAGEDFDQYPRDLDKDKKDLQRLGVDFLFFPQDSEMYPDPYLTYVTVEEWQTLLCGQSRPHHFRGVTTIVLKLFNIIGPDYAYFGQKDAQQAIILKKMVKDLNVPVSLRILPIVRDADGLALSSRNSYLTSKERQAARKFPEALNKARFRINEGQDSAQRIRDEIIEDLKQEKMIKIDYVEIVSLDKLRQVNKIDRNNTLVAAAIKIGKTRLIDNFILGEI